MSTIMIKKKKGLFLSLTLLINILQKKKKKLLINNYGRWDLGHSAVATGAGFGVYLLEFGQTQKMLRQDAKPMKSQNPNLKVTT